MIVLVVLLLLILIMMPCCEWIRSERELLIAIPVAVKAKTLSERVCGKEGGSSWSRDFR